MKSSLACALAFLLAVSTSAPAAVSVGDTPTYSFKATNGETVSNETLKGKLVLVDFWAVWCGPCKQIAPLVTALADEYQGRLNVAKMDVDHHQIVPQQYGIKSIPTLLIFKGGKVVSQLVGVMPRSKLEAEIQKHL